MPCATDGGKACGNVQAQLDSPRLWQQLAKQLLQTTRKCRLADQLPAPDPSCLEAYVRHVRVSVSLSVCVCVCCNSYWSMAATPTAVPWRLCRHRRPIGTDRAACLTACLGCLRGTCHTPHATRRRRMPHTPHAVRLVKLLILLPATLIFNK